ncbi:hypothetical protein J8F10_24100 [Gemmata sp. G18]|uniref:Uncharacterized protein n=1 Tax=Gemmata palustris TaxID=2822762 RepID=A0ABS5BXG0_9BACT|nr:hypothetical protein [Gemmata palustris]MBP3958343.1 hypothetical protein [Gemmata palustris]
MPNSYEFQPNDAYNLTATIASGQTTSAEIDLTGADLCGLFMPAAFTGTTIKIQAAPASGGTFVTVQSGGADYALPVAASKYVPIENLAVVAGLRFIKLVSGSSEGADRSITLAVRPV